MSHVFWGFFCIFLGCCLLIYPSNPPTFDFFRFLGALGFIVPGILAYVGVSALGG